MAFVQSREDRLVLAVDDTEINEAKSLVDCLDRASGPAVVEIAAPDVNKMVVPSALAGLMRAVLDGIGRGAQVTIQAVPREATTTTAAKMLGISRPTLMKLIADGKLPAHKVGSHTRLLTAEVMAFRERQREAQRRAFDELRELDEGLEMAP
ncbi:helix-turn-helix domain-containing protein [Mycolicibacter icosiumassiliensis]|uniref:helix-turn-helix domain-containing protein n=1 Tax=Mycolicibacter icosiumassiliensis TaxID=1792835 RepID=UPI00082A1854|nr:helix-turn-helix domain-containing protein [Mycolicibacter icosiumassiliensis]